jgi:histidine triad (HIT) family protein
MAKACVFCSIARGDEPAAIVAREDGLLAFLDARPVFKGHLLAIPAEHIPDLGGLKDAGPLFGFVQRLALAVEAGLGADGSFVAVNNKISQSVPHLHAHVVPRRKGDGLRGFFWPRTKYDSDEERAGYARRIAEALGSRR